MFYPNRGTATGRDEIERSYADVGETVSSTSRDYTYFNWVVDDDTVVVEGTNTGSTADGTDWRPGDSTGGDRWCDVFEVRDGKIHRLFIYLDPDYAGNDTDRYPWL